MKREDGTRQQATGVSRDANLRPEFVKILKTMLLLGRPYGPNYILRLLKGSDYPRNPGCLKMTISSYRCQDHREIRTKMGGSVLDAGEVV